jgi:hypothetical protein
MMHLFGFRDIANQYAGAAARIGDAFGDLLEFAACSAE